MTHAQGESSHCGRRTNGVEAEEAKEEITMVWDRHTLAGDTQSMIGKGREMVLSPERLPGLCPDVLNTHCFYCGYEPVLGDMPLVWDHVYPDLREMTPQVRACLWCNSSKGNRDPEAFRQMRLGPDPRSRRRSIPGLPTQQDPTFWAERVGLQIPSRPKPKKIKEDSYASTRT